MNRRYAALAALLAALSALAPGAGAQPNALMSAAEAEQHYQRTLQLMESTMISVPGLARAAEPILENSRQALANLRVSPGQRNAGLTYLLLTNIRAYEALADSIPKPFPFPAEASKQFAELRVAIERTDSHLRALLDYVEASARNPDRDNLARYEEDNQKVGAPNPANPRVVFLGDSITDGWRLNEYFPERDFINRGISGQISGEMLGRMRSDVLNLKPAILVVLAGTNDIARGVKQSVIEDNLAMIAMLAKANNVKVILSSVLPVNDFNKDEDPRFERTRQRPPVAILRLNTWIRSYCSQAGHHYLDYYSPMADAGSFLKKDLADDGLHPNTNGYRIMAPLVQAAIDKIAPASPAPARKRRFPFGE
ncbi:MAG: SGNH/GDSL hydrolase family protein [Bryobacteraceae bacterium]|nr:SGNH/GDSL hydrolase family protein [Bryobacteraceae bacterium]